MRKWLAIFGMLLTVAPIMASQPNQATDSKHATANQVQGEGKTVGADQADKQASGQTDQPKANTDPPGRYTALERPDWWLVIVATLTAAVICWQSIETRRAAKGALLNAQALITAERPWLVAYFTKSQEETIPESGHLRFNWEVKNVGRTPARLTFAAGRVVFNIDAVPLPDMPDYGESDYYFTERTLVPGGTFRYLSHWYEWKDGRYRQLYQTDDVKAVDLLIGFGCVKYRDTFGSGKEYVTCFSDSSVIGGRSIFEPFSPWMEAPAEYTKCT
jgi:hypothetical protein